MREALPTEHSDCELIAACARQEAWAWDALVDRYKALVYSIALGAGLGSDDAADVFQTVFTLLLEHLHTLRAPQGLAAWLITTTKRESWDVARKRQREPAASDALSTLAAAGEWHSGAQAVEALWAERALIHDALKRLGERCRQLLSLLYLEPAEPSYEEISRRLRMPLGSIGPTRARCLEKMRQILRGMSAA